MRNSVTSIFMKEEKRQNQKIMKEEQNQILSIFIIFKMLYFRHSEVNRKALRTALKCFIFVVELIFLEVY